MDTLDSRWLLNEINRVASAPVSSDTMLTSEFDAEAIRSYIEEVELHFALSQNEISGCVVSKYSKAKAVVDEFQYVDN